MMRSTMLAGMLLALGAALPIAAGAQERRGGRGGEEFRSRIDTTFAFSRSGVIDLELVSGEIVVTAASRDEVRVRAHSERGRLQMDASSSRLTLEAESDRGRMGDTRFELAVPVGVRVVAHTVSGDIAIRGTRGAVEAHSINGDIEVESATDLVTIESVSGDVTASRLEGEVRIEAVSGSVELADVTGDIRVESTSGEIALVRATSRNVNLTTVSGGVLYQGSIDANGRYEFHSHSGDVHLEVPSNVSARFDVETFSGALESEFEVVLQPGERVGRRPRRFEFSVGAGGARVTAETFSGDIVLRRAGSRSNR